MTQDLVEQLRIALQKRKGDWKYLAARIPGVSYSWISRIARGQYSSEPSYRRVRQVLDYLAEEDEASSGGEERPRRSPREAAVPS